MKKIWSDLKPYLRWLILGGTLFFVLKAFKDHWREVAAIRLNSEGLLLLALALLATLLAHTWSAWVWTWMLAVFKQSVNQRWALQVYLETNIAKYLPGNIWHYYGRISAVTKAGGSPGSASLSVVLEPILMATAALSTALMSSQLGLIVTARDTHTLALQIFGVGAVLLAIHPRVLNPVLHFLSRLRLKDADTDTVKIAKYPWLPLLGEFGFLGLRGSGFLLTLMALMPVTLDKIPLVLSSFSFAWLLGLLVPVAPGGLGVFEATAIALLDEQYFPAAIVLSAVALYRLISIAAEVSAAGMAWLSRNLSEDKL